MKKQKFTETQIVSISKQYAGGREALELSREYGIPKPLFIFDANRFSGFHVFDQKMARPICLSRHYWRCHFRTLHSCASLRAFFFRRFCDSDPLLIQQFILNVMGNYILVDGILHKRSYSYHRNLG